MNELCFVGNCSKVAKYEVRSVDHGTIGRFCKEHKGLRGDGYAPFEIDAPECSAMMDDGLPCSNRAKFLVRRPFSGIESVCCGVHRPPKLHIATHAVEVVSLEKVGA